MIHIRAKISRIQNTGKKGAEIMTSFFLLFIIYLTLHRGKRFILWDFLKMLIKIDSLYWIWKIYIMKQFRKIIYTKFHEIFRYFAKFREIKYNEISRNFAKLKSLSSLFRISRNKKNPISRPH
jgi:hypothetical protein